MEDASKILNQLKNMEPAHIYYSDEEYFTRYFKPSVSNLNLWRQFANQLPPMEPPIAKKDLGFVKYYGPSDLDDITEGFRDGNLITKTLFGRLFRGKVWCGSESRDVVVKTWDFYYPRSQLQKTHTTRFSGEIELLLLGELSEENDNLVKLVGYCFEKKLAVVYNIKAKGTLDDELSCVTFDWASRINVAYKFACLLERLHDKSIVFGAINSSCTLIDEEYNIAPFEFGMLAKLGEGNHSFSIGNLSKTINWPRLYHMFCPDAEEGVWYLKSDVFAFGILLWELISGTKVDKKKATYETAEDWAKIQKADTSHVNTEFNQDADTCAAVSRLVVSCVAPTPDDRPDMRCVVNTMKTFLEVESVSSKKQKM